MDSSTHLVGWISDPNGRGTLSLIISCLLTIGLCVWSALHLNIPPLGQGPVGFWVRNLKWMGLGLFIPELVVFAAWRQFNSAKSLKLELEDVGWGPEKSIPGKSDTETQIEDSVLRERNAWSIVHGFYAGMGGFVIELDAAAACKLSKSYTERQRFTLTPRGVLLMSRCGLLPKLSRREIDDKSKADALAKSFVCLQAGWMIAQILGRVKARLPITLFEVNTIGHIVCAFAIYLLWWFKPRLIAEPTHLEGDAIAAVCNFMWMSSRISDPNKLPQYPFFAPQRFAEFTRLAFCHCKTSSSLGQIDNSPEGRDFRPDGEQGVVSHPKFSPRQGADVAKQSDRLQAYKPGFGHFEPRTASLTETLESTPARWYLALQAMESFPPILERLQPSTAGSHSNPYEIRCEELLTKRSSNWPSEGLLRGLPGLLMGMALWFVTIAYGAVHVAAWNVFFPTVLERWLWRASSLYIMWSGLLWLSINALGKICPRFNDYWEALLAREGSTIVYAILGFLCTVCGLAYGFARMYLVIESIISLRLLPLAAYDTPQWSQVVPHL